MFISYSPLTITEVFQSWYPEGITERSEIPIEDKWFLVNPSSINLELFAQKGKTQSKKLHASLSMRLLKKQRKTQKNTICHLSS